MWKKSVIVLALAISSVSVNAKERKIVTPLAGGLVAANHIVAIEVIVNETAAENMVKFEAKAAEKRAEAKLAPVDTQSAPSAIVATPEVGASVISASASGTVAGQSADGPRPARAEYATLPFKMMFPLVIEDVTHEWGLTGGRAIKLKVTIDTLKTANAGMALLLGSSDQLAGMVEIADAQTEEALGSFYIDVVNSHSGWGGLLIRGSGIREKLVEEFALQTSRVLTGRKSKTPKVIKS